MPKNPSFLLDPCKLAFTITGCQQLGLFLELFQFLKRGSNYHHHVEMNVYNESTIVGNIIITNECLH